MLRTSFRSLRWRATFWMAVFLLGIAIAIRFVNYYVTRDILLRDIDTQLWTRLGALKMQQRFAMLLNFLEQILLAGLIIRGFAGLVGLFGLGARALHVGNANAYAYWFLLGAVALWAFATGFLTF